MLAIIGGTGLTRLSTLDVSRREVVRTPYGEPSSALVHGSIHDQPVVFLARHGHGHTIPPHRVNYRANLWALQSREVDTVIAVASVGGISKECYPGALVSPHQLIDYTSDRAATFFDGGDRQVVHVDFTHPYSLPLRQRCLSAAAAAGVALHDGGVYAAVSGPRLETAAEVDRLERDGATMVGMTGMPEAVLARELGLSYAAIALVVNHAASRGDSSAGISVDRIAAVVETSMEQVCRIIAYLVKAS